MPDWKHAMIEAREMKVVLQIDGHYCHDWDGLAVSAWTMEYDACTDYQKTRLGRAINRVVVWRWNLGWWRYVGIPNWFRERLENFHKRFPRFPVSGFGGC